MLKLAAFADEISPNLDEQIRVCLAHGVKQIELRGVNKINVLDFNPSLRQEIKRKLADSGMVVACIASPIGKVSIDKPFAEHMDRFKIAVELAEYFASPLIRVFSYYSTQGRDEKEILTHRDEVMDRFRRKLDYISGRDVVLVHENEHAIYGEKVAQCVDLLQTMNSPQLRAAFDPANFVVAGEDPEMNWPLLKPYTIHFHIKDALMSTGKIVPAGQGDGKIGRVLADAWNSGYRGLLSLEPHLKFAGHSHGETGEALFKVAADALKELCRTSGVPLDC